MSEPTVPLAHQFEEPAQQQEAATLGMWIFLATEVLLFGGLFLAYIVYRDQAPQAFAAASGKTMLVAGTINTAVLLVSSYFVANAVHLTTLGRRKVVVVLLLAAVLLAAVFLVIKGFEYHHKIEEGLFPGMNFHFPGGQARGAQMFFVLYFTMTGLHALHVAVGAAILAVCAGKVLLSPDPARLATMVDVSGLYWHFVDIVWVFLFPLFYLISHRS
ncbi:MAG TPA: cytochrome c oxidase subunit 3 [Chthoniobacterales bacterium]